MRELEQCFKGLADQNRLRILNLLLHGELCVCDIHYVLETSQPNTSRHLIYLKNAGLILDRREGTRMYYRLAKPDEEIHKLLFAFLRSAFQRFGSSRRGLPQTQEGHRNWLLHHQRMEAVLRTGADSWSKQSEIIERYR